MIALLLQCQQTADAAADIRPPGVMPLNGIGTITIFQRQFIVTDYMGFIDQRAITIGTAYGQKTIPAVDILTPLLYSTTIGIADIYKTWSIPYLHGLAPICVLLLTFSENSHCSNQFLSLQNKQYTGVTMGDSDTTGKGQIIYLSHGGGPLPILGDHTHAHMVSFLKELPEKLHRPEAIIVFSAHWEESVATIQGSASPGLLYDYYGFPEESYMLQYPAKGVPTLAEKIAGHLKEAGIPHKIDNTRPYDHGSFIPLLLMYPEADIPVIQVSLLNSLDAEKHLSLGLALAPLVQKNILFIGSGFSYHNMRGFDFSGADHVDQDNDAFQDWLISQCCTEMALKERLDNMIDWQQAPHARYCHPREEHLLPLHICIGLAGKKGRLVFDDYIVGKHAVAFLW